jgi:ActR/RegA family two-component response regulator
VNKRLLLIDDDETILFALKRYFEHAGYDVQCARELEEAEALVVCSVYDLVIIDLCLSPDCLNEGLQLIRFMQRHCPESRVIVLTASTAAAVEREAIRRGAHLFLQKPQPLASIARCAHQLLGGAA